LWFLFAVPGPLINLLAIPARGLISLLFGRPPAPPGASREEFRALTDVFEREGTLDPAETQLIHNVLDFHKVQVRDVMIPLSRVTAVPLDMPLPSVIDLARQTEIDQFPLIDPGGDLVGIINVMELLRDQARRGTADRYRRALIESTPTEAAIAAIKRLRRSGQQLAAVYDEKRRPIGIVSAHDAVERMVQVAS
jgi:CBS domain containing-hemolysin-like protein